MKLLPIAFLVFATVARAVTYVGNQVLVASTNFRESANLIGNVTLSHPGTYTASSWNIVGNVTFSAPGEYLLVATNGGVTITGRLIGTAGSTTLRVNHQGGLNVVLGSTSSGVTVIDGNAAPVVVPPPPLVTPVASGAPLVNISTRARLASGAVLNPGFVIGGHLPRRVVVRAIGPGLGQFGVASPMVSPTLAIFRGATEIARNDGWSHEADAESFAAVGAFPLTPGSRDAALVLTLAPGAYTATVSGSAGDSGDVLFELYSME